MSPGLALVGLSILGTWGLATIAIIASGVIMLFFPGSQETNSGHVAGGIFLLAVGLISGGMMQIIVMPLLGLDPPLPIKAKSIVPHSRMKAWASAGKLDDFQDGLPKEIRLRSLRVTIVRQGESAYALAGQCPHARLPFGGFPGSPLKAEPIRDDCVACPFHGARFELATGRVVRQPFTSEFNDNHPFLGRLQSKLLFFNKKSEDVQTFPVRMEGDEIMVGLPR